MASVRQLNQAVNDDNFELMFSSKMEDFIFVSKYKSKRTGITVCIGEVEGPTVNGHICLATEAHDNDGLPHTLEHLIFLGSEDYPYKGVLDLVANRCMASGTNAWTATDHTCYTVTTAGSEGFLNFLPIYLDHILYPTLTDCAFLTEVHHINGKGDDAGVVYCEMQGIENTDSSITSRALLNSLYPGRCGYKSETGGMLTNLRDSTTNVKVCEYHRTFYRPENLCIIVTGQVAAQSIFDALYSTEEKILSKGLQGDYCRPWQSPVPPLEQNVNKVVLYPCDDEDYGLVYIAWRGPKSSSLYELVALDSLLLYLMDTAIAPLQREFVEIDEPYCNKVLYSVMEYSEGFIQVNFDNVPRSKLNQVESKLLEVLTRIYQKEERLDMQRFNSVIHRKIVAILSEIESEPHEIVVSQLIQDFLHGTGNDNLQERLNRVKMLEELKKANETFWLDLLQKYFLNKHRVTIIGEPSHSYMKKTTAEEKKRIELQRKALGDDGLNAKAIELKSAMEANEISPPDNMIASFKVPSLDSIQFHNIRRFSNYSDLAPNAHPKFLLNTLPFRFQLDDIHSNFVNIHAVLNTSNVPQGLKMCMPLLLEIIFETSIIRDGVVIPYEVVVKELADDTVDASACLGLSTEKRFTCGQVAQIAHIAIKMEISKYEKGVRWLCDLMFNTKFTEERIKIIATKMVNDVPELKRKGSFIASCLSSELCYIKESNHRVNNLMRQHAFLNSLLEKLKSDPDQVTDSLEKLRTALISFDNLTIHMATDVEKLTSVVGDPCNIWTKQFSQFSSGHNDAVKSLEVQPCHQLLVPFEERSVCGAIVGVGSVESAYLEQFAPSLNLCTHPDLPVVMVLLQYLTQTEGPMWRQIRGLGLAYGYSSDIEPDKGILSLELYRSAQLFSAYKEAKKIVESHVNGTQKWDETLVESACSSLMFEIIGEEDTVQALSGLSLWLHLNKLDQEYNKNLLKGISKVTIEDLNAIGPKYLPALFEASRSRLAICCHPSKCEKIAAGFKKLSYNLQIVNLEGSFMDSLEPSDLPWEVTNIR